MKPSAPPRNKKGRKKHYKRKKLLRILKAIGREALEKAIEKLVEELLDRLCG